MPHLTSPPLVELPGDQLRELVDAYLLEHETTVGGLAELCWPELSGASSEKKLRRLLPSSTGQPPRHPWPAADALEAVCRELGVELRLEFRRRR